MNGVLPPSSNDSFFTVPAHFCIANLPTSIEPVKVSLRTVGLLVSSPPISFDGPVTDEKTPFGTPARSASSHEAKAENGVAVAGLGVFGGLGSAGTNGAAGAFAPSGGILSHYFLEFLCFVW